MSAPMSLGDALSTNLDMLISLTQGRPRLNASDVVIAVLGRSMPQDQARISISPGCVSAVDSPGIVSILRNRSEAAWAAGMTAAEAIVASSVRMRHGIFNFFSLV